MNEGSELLQLHVWHQGAKVGTITYSPKEDRFGFNYTSDWMRKKRFLISPHIRYEEPDSDLVKRFLENLLPEGRGLTYLARWLKVSQSNVFSLVNSIGRDLSGGLDICIEESTVPTKFREVSLDELEERIKNRIKEPLAVWDGKPRLSLAGVQDKLPVLKFCRKKLDSSSRSVDQYGFGEGKLSSTHILKFEQKESRHLVLNEAFCMGLARRVGLNVADSKVVSLGEKVLEVERFDRQWKGEDEIHKLHVIDGCQALDISPVHKYERFLGDEKSVRNILGPANLSNLYQFCNQCRNPAKTRLQLIRWVLLNLLIGNSDAHLKNISYFVDDEGIRLAPFYDLLCVSIYPLFSHSLAFAIGEQFEPERITHNDLYLMADELDLQASFIKRQFQILFKVIKKVLASRELAENLGGPDLRISLSEEELKFIETLKNHILENIGRYEDMVRNL